MTNATTSAFLRRMRAADYLDLGIIGSAHGLSDGFSSLLVPVLALIVAEFGLSSFQAGLLLSISSVSAFLVLYPVSILADHGGKKKAILLVGMSLAAAAFLSMRWAQTFIVIALLTFLAEAGNAVFHPCGTSLTAERFAGIRAFAISVYGLMGNIGASLMPALQTAVAIGYGWRPSILACALPAAVLLPLLAVRFPKGSSAPAAHHPVSIRASFLSISSAVLRNRNVVLLAAVYALKGMGAKAAIGFVPLLATGKFGMGTALIGTAVTLYFAAGIAAKPVMGYLYARWGARSALAGPLVASGALALGVGIAPWPVMLIILLALLGATGPISPIILTAASDLSDEKTLASSVGFIYTCYGLGFLSPIAAGWLSDRFGLAMPFILSACLIWLAAGVSTLLPGRKTAPAD